MAQLVCNAAQMQCSFGIAPAVLIITPENMVFTSNMPAATIMDYVPMKNIPTFGMCQSIANPAVAAATSAALGVFTPAPCIPVTTAPWAPGSPTVLVSNKPALNNTSKCMCTWGGVISIIAPGQMQTTVP
ncbi:MAG: DUF4280 domain-containing protein [Chloroflexi bacterium]|nr:DUF4280 domain-containing protein [Chloroflexota bacterium]MBP8056372.1 DUF4280 domain-containing protein [Chloroflexota bacterium]